MGRKKKGGPEAPPPAAPAAAPPPQAPTEPPPQAPAEKPPEPEPDMEEILKDAERWAAESGLKPPFMLTGPERTPYPQRGHGYMVTVHEKAGRCRMGTARFSSSGRRSMWTIDGAYAG